MSYAKLRPWRPIDGTGQSTAFTAGAAAAVTNAMDSQTYAVRLCATGGDCLVRISNAGTAATATNDVYVKSTDMPVEIGCQPGEKISVWGIGTGTLFCVDLTH